MIPYIYKDTTKLQKSSSILTIARGNTVEFITALLLMVISKNCKALFAL